jgi:hypothetical protein
MDVVPGGFPHLVGDPSSGTAGESDFQVDPAAGNQLARSGCDRFQILALDGGGAKALFTAHVLARLEQDLDVRITDSFDLIAGTSAGGIVALGLGAGLSACS